MGKSSDNPKTTSDKEQVENKTVTKEPADAPLTLAEAQAAMEAPEGEVEASIEKERLQKDTRIAPDLKGLKKEQVEKKKEVKQKKAEVKEAVKEIKGVKEEKEEPSKPSEPSKFEGKSDEERLKIYQDMEKNFTKVSQKNKELEQKVTELGEVDRKIAEMEKQSVITQQKATTVMLPEYPKINLFYEEPEKYHQQVKNYYDAKISAMVTPLYGQNWSTQKQNTVNKLKEVTKNDIVPYEGIESEVESRLKKNPALINQYGLRAREYVYAQVRNEQIPQKIEDMKTTAIEQAKKELQEENKEISEAQMMSSDITTQSRGSKPIDLEKMLEEGKDPEEIIKTYKKKYKIDFQL